MEVRTHVHTQKSYKQLLNNLLACYPLNYKATSNTNGNMEDEDEKLSFKT